jgi:hypothetical protein
MLDWYVIEIFFPKSFELFSKTMFPNVGIPSISVLQYYDIKKLYRFFDKNGVYLTVEMLTKYHWIYNISMNDNCVMFPCQEPKHNRELIEIDGFFECFRLMEIKLRLN